VGQAVSPALSRVPRSGRGELRYSARRTPVAIGGQYTTWAGPLQ